ncbi:MAG: hypothetical protein GX043_12650, partial [Desulfovibrionales bacterium]|nr:hypothetical protein [Desulfovibrionales bacterium]
SVFYEIIENYRHFLYLGDTSLGTYDLVTNIVFSSTTQAVAFAARTDKKWYVVLDEQSYGPYGYIQDLQFALDGQALAYNVIIDGNYYSRIVVDGQEHMGSICNGEILYVQDRKTYRK